MDNNEKKLFLFDDGCGEIISMLLSKEQYCVFEWFKNRGYDFSISKVDEYEPEIIDTKEWGRDF